MTTPLVTPPTVERGRRLARDLAALMGGYSRRAQTHEFIVWRNFPPARVRRDARGLPPMQGSPVLNAAGDATAR